MLFVHFLMKNLEVAGAPCYEDGTGGNDND